MLLHESAALLIRHGETRVDAEKRAKGFVLSYSQKVSGQELYFRKDLKFDAQKKRDVIRADFRAGISVFQLSEKYKLSTVRVYQVLNRKETELTETDTSLKAPLMVEAARMLLKAGIENEDAASAARGLTAVILARFSGIIISMPKQKIIKHVIRSIEIVRHFRAGKSNDSIADLFGLSVEEINDIVTNYPTATIPDSAELPKIRTRLFTMAANFSGYAEINALLESATKQISRAEEIISKL